MLTAVTIAYVRINCSVTGGVLFTIRTDLYSNNQNIWFSLLAEEGTHFLIENIHNNLFLTIFCKLETVITNVKFCRF